MANEKTKQNIQMESTLEDNSINDGIFFGYTRRIQILESKLEEIVSKNGFSEEAKERQEDDEETETEDESEDSEEYSSDESIENEVKENIDKAMFKAKKEESSTMNETTNLEVSSLKNNKIGIEEKRKQLEESEMEKEALLSELVDMAALMKGEATSISTHLIDQNQVRHILLPSSSFFNIFVCFFCFFFFIREYIATIQLNG